MMLDHYQQTKNLLVSYSIDPLGFLLSPNYCLNGLNAPW
jgi:hypothetical protein